MEDEKKIERIKELRDAIEALQEEFNDAMPPVEVMERLVDEAIDHIKRHGIVETRHTVLVRHDPVHVDGWEVDDDDDEDDDVFQKILSYINDGQYNIEEINREEYDDDGPHYAHCEYCNWWSDDYYDVDDCIQGLVDHAIEWALKKMDPIIERWREEMEAGVTDEGEPVKFIKMPRIPDDEADEITNTIVRVMKDAVHQQE